jgi:hypothetical protein
VVKLVGEDFAQGVADISLAGNGLSNGGELGRVGNTFLATFVVFCFLSYNRITSPIRLPLASNPFLHSLVELSRRLEFGFHEKDSWPRLVLKLPKIFISLRHHEIIQIQ